MTFFLVEIEESTVFQNEKALKIWIWCLLRANHKSNNFLLGRKKMTVEKGQFIMGLNKASEHLNLAKSTIYYWLKFLEEEGQVELQKTNKYTLVKIKNWSEFQDVELKKNSKKTLKETNKKDKNVKNEKNKQELADKSASKEINKIMAIFGKINPTINYGHRTQRTSAGDLIKQFGFSEVERIAELAVSIQGRQYAPTITNPYLLKTKFADLGVYIQREKNRSGNIASI